MVSGRQIPGLKLVCLVLALFMCFAVQALHAETVSSSFPPGIEDTGRIYPKPADLFSPRVYGNANAPNNVVLMIAPGNDSDEKFYITVYPLLTPLVNAGKVRLEIKLWGHQQGNLPYFLVAQCLDPNAMPLYLYNLFINGEAVRYSAATDVEAYAVQQALQDPQFLMPGLSKDQFRQRLNWCLSKRREGMIYSETSRHGSIYNWGLRDSGVWNTAAVVNQKVFDGEVDPQDIIKSLQERKP
jgi:hypothetical protein